MSTKSKQPFDLRQFCDRLEAGCFTFIETVLLDGTMERKGSMNDLTDVNIFSNLIEREVFIGFASQAAHDKVFRSKKDVEDLEDFFETFNTRMHVVVRKEEMKSIH